MTHRFYENANARMLAAVRSANIKRERKRTKERVRNYFGSYAAWYVQAFRALKYKEGETLEEREARANVLAKNVDPFHASRGRVRWWRVEKRSEGYRILCDLPPVLRVRQLMIRQVLSVLFRPAGHIFDIRGRGRDELARSVAAAMEEGFTHAFVADLRNCFPSVNPDALYDLPLPNQVIRYALDYRNLKFRHLPRKEAETCPSLYGDTPGPRRIGPSGLLQGSQAANLTLAWLFNDMDQVLSSSCRLFLLSDDIIVLARSEGACLEIEQTLAEYFRLHQAGPFVLEGDICKLCDGFEKVGYSFGRSALSGHGSVDFSGANADKVLRRVNAAIAEDKAAGRVSAVKARLALQQAISGFSAITGRDAFVEASLEYIDDELTHHAFGFGEPRW